MLSLKTGQSWDAIEVAVQQFHKYDGLEAFLQTHLGDHDARTSPLVTTIVNIINAERWLADGHTPSFVLGHSIGEVAAAYMAGWLSVGEAMRVAHGLGQLGALRDGAMAHDQMTRAEVDGWLDSALCIATVNGMASIETDPSLSLLSVTICGPSKDVDRWLVAHPRAKKLLTPHPWHHPIYLSVPSIADGSAFAALPKGCMPSTSTEKTAFMPTMTAGHVECLDAAYWRAWLTTSVDFMGALQRVAAQLLSRHKSCYIIEMGPHPVLTSVASATLGACGLHVITTAESMRRGQFSGYWEDQRSRLESSLILSAKLRRKSSLQSDAFLPSPTGAPLLSRIAPQGKRREVSSEGCDIMAWVVEHATGGEVSVGDYDAPLMTLGVESNQVPVIAQKLTELFEEEVPATWIFQYSTIRAMAKHLSAPLLESLEVSAESRQANAMSDLPKAQQEVRLCSSTGHWPGAMQAALLVPLTIAGGDAIFELPALHWLTIDTTPGVGFGGIIVGAEYFDHAMFSISPAEVQAMDPQQRMLLEVGYETTHGAGLRRGELLGADLGIFVGLMNTDFASLANSANVYAATGSQVSIASGRLAFVLGTQGPCVSIDTACSSALVALDAAALNLRDCDTALAAAANLLLQPFVSLLFACAGMLSADGRCKTFDARANGYVRSEGIGAVALDSEDTGLALGGCAVRADGKSASLTAPNGSAQARMIGAALAAAGLTRLCVVETHGTGTPLGDPTELGGLERVISYGGLCVGGVKANLGHTEPAAGFSGLLALMLLPMQGVTGINAQLRTLNPLLALPLRALRAYVPAQGVQPGGEIPAGVSSFGYSGTIAHAIVLRGNVAQPSVKEPIAFRRRSLAWHAPVHPFAQQQLLVTDAHVFRLSMAGTVCALVADHVVRGNIVFPAAGYLEMANAAVSILSGAHKLNDVCFLIPLFATQTPHIDCLVKASSFEVHSQETTHCTGKVAVAACSCVKHLPIQTGSEAVERTPEEVFAALFCVGLQYGPTYRRLKRVWVARTDSWAQLLPRTNRMCTALHPAELDAALQLSVLPRASEPTLRLPFAVREALLCRGSTSMWAAIDGHGMACLANKSGLKLSVLLNGTQVHAAKAESQLKDAYQTLWTSAARGTAPTSSVLLIGALELWRFSAMCGSTTLASVGYQSVVLALATLQHARPDELAILEVALMLAQAASPVSTWLVTVTVRTTDGPAPLARGASMWGLARSTRQEVPSLAMCCVDVCQPYLPTLHNAIEPELAPRGDLLLVPRLSRAQLPHVGTVRLHYELRGAIGGLRIIALDAAARLPLAPEEATLAIRATSLNFRDVLNVLGEYPGDQQWLDGDCAGSALFLGAAVSHVSSGDAVFGIASAPLASRAHADARLLACKPSVLSFEAACTLPVTWSTVHIALGRSLLHHSSHFLVQAAAGGVGLVAVKYGQLVSAVVVATAGRRYKHFHLSKIGCRGSSRDATAFGVGLTTGLRAIRLHVALNSLSLDFIAASLALLGEGGDVEEIGKRCVWSVPRGIASYPTVTYDVLALDLDWVSNPSWFGLVLRDLGNRVDSGQVRALALQSFDLVVGFSAAFRLLQSGLNVGKVVLVLRNDGHNHEGPAKHLITGGTGGLGLCTARWLARANVTLVLVSRSGVIPPEAADSLNNSSACVVVVRADVGNASDVRRSLSVGISPCLKGIWHAAGVLADGLLAAQSWMSMQSVAASKACAAAWLHRASLALSLRTCVLFSSVTALLGGVGQINYSAANSGLDALATARHAGAQCAVSVQWGPWAIVGMAATEPISRRWRAQGYSLIQAAQGLAALGAALHPHAPALLAVVPVAWSVVLRSMSHAPAFLGRVVSTATGAQSAEFSKKSSRLDMSSVLEIVERTVGSTTDADQSLIEAGVDSLGAVELRNLLQHASGMALPSSITFDHPTARQLGTVFEKHSPRGGASTNVTLPKSAFNSIVGAPADAQLPCSSFQHQLLLHQLLFPQSTAYNEALTITMDSCLSASLARAALASLVWRHAVLRTYFVFDMGRAQFHQAVFSADGFVVPLKHSTLSSSWGDELEDEICTPFDLFHAPPIRAMLLVAEQSQLVVTVHHVAADLEALKIIHMELAAHCTSLAHGVVPEMLNPLKFEYVDFAVWESARAEDDVGLQWWLSQLSDVPEVITLPQGRTRPAVQATPGVNIEFHLRSDLVARLNGLCVSAGATLNCGLLSFWGALLLHMSGQSDVVVGVPHSMRYMQPID